MNILYQMCLLYAARLGTIEKLHGTNPADEEIRNEITEIANFFFGQMEPQLALAYPEYPAVV